MFPSDGYATAHPSPFIGTQEHHETFEDEPGNYPEDGELTQNVHERKQRGEKPGDCRPNNEVAESQRQKKRNDFPHQNTSLSFVCCY